MKELNLEVGQKVWSIQLGDCEVKEKTENYYLIWGKICDYYYCLDGKFEQSEYYRSLFESNPFEPRLVQENKDEWVESRENKAELINALFNVANNGTNIDLEKIATEKLQKLLESI